MRSYPQPEFSLAKRTISASKVGRDARPAGRGTGFGAVEFAGNEPPVPGEDGIGSGDAGDLLKRSAAEPPTDLNEGGSFRIRQAHAGGKVGWRMQFSAARYSFWSRSF
jgi:hypothetical protein